MPKPKKPTHGGARPGAGQPKGPAKKLVSARVLERVYTALLARAEANGNTPSKEAEQILTDVLTPP